MLSASVLLSLAATVLVAGVLGLLIWETVRLALARVPITGLVRYSEAHLQLRWVCTAYFVMAASSAGLSPTSATSKRGAT